MKRISLGMGLLFSLTLLLISATFMAQNMGNSIWAIIASAFFVAFSGFGTALSTIALVRDLKKPARNENKIWLYVGALLSLIMTIVFGFFYSVLFVGSLSPETIIIMIAATIPLSACVFSTMFFVIKMIRGIRRSQIIELSSDFAERNIEKAWLWFGIVSSLNFSTMLILSIADSIVGLISKSYLYGSFFTKTAIIIQLIGSSAFLALFIVTDVFLIRLLIRLRKAKSVAA